MQTEQRGRTDVPVPRYKLTRAPVILTVFAYRRWVAFFHYMYTPEGVQNTNPPHAALSSPLGGLPKPTPDTYDCA